MIERRFTPCRPPVPQDRLSQSKRRWEASRRLPSLECGCSPDPWLCRCTEPPLSTRAIDAWRDAAKYVLAQGRTPLVPLEALRALHRRGGPDRELAIELWGLTSGEVA